MSGDTPGKPVSLEFLKHHPVVVYDSLTFTDGVARVSVRSALWAGDHLTCQVDPLRHVEPMPEVAAAARFGWFFKPGGGCVGPWYWEAWGSLEGPRSLRFRALLNSEHVLPGLPAEELLRWEQAVRDDWRAAGPYHDWLQEQAEVWQARCEALRDLLKRGSQQ